MPTMSEKIARHKLLGEVPDRVVADDLGCSTGLVCKIRNEVGKQPGPTVTFTEKIRTHKLLGQVSDRTIAEEIGCTTVMVAAVRKREGIEHAPLTRKNTHTELIRAHPQLGILLDKDIAEEIGCSAALVSVVRSQKNIPAARSVRPAAVRPPVVPEVRVTPDWVREPLEPVGRFTRYPKQPTESTPGALQEKVPPEQTTTTMPNKHVWKTEVGYKVAAKTLK